MNKKSESTVVQEKFQGSKGWLLFWVIVFFPVAIYYYLTRKEPVRVKIKKEKTHTDGMPIGLKIVIAWTVFQLVGLIIAFIQHKNNPIQLGFWVISGVAMIVYALISFFAEMLILTGILGRYMWTYWLVIGWYSWGIIIMLLDIFAYLFRPEIFFTTYAVAQGGKPLTLEGTKQTWFIVFMIVAMLVQIGINTIIMRLVYANKDYLKK